QWGIVRRLAPHPQALIRVESRMFGKNCGRDLVQTPCAKRSGAQGGGGLQELAAIQSHFSAPRNQIRLENIPEAIAHVPATAGIGNRACYTSASPFDGEGTMRFWFGVLRKQS